MYVAPVANSEWLAIKKRFLDVGRFTLTTFWLLTWLPRKLGYHLFWLTTYMVGLLTFLIMVGLAWILVNNNFLNDQTITYDHATGRYQHSDVRSGYFLNYASGRPLPQSERLRKLQLYVKSIYDDAAMEPPRNILSLTEKQLAEVFLKFMSNTRPKYTHREELFDLAFSDKSLEFASIKKQAEEPPLDGKYTEIWRLAEKGGAPKFRWLEEKDEFASWFMAASADGNSAFYFPFNDTIYAGYRDPLGHMMDEVPHAIQFRERPVRSYFKLLTGYGRASVCTAGEFFDRLKVHYQLEYHRPGSIEYEAHNIMEPKATKEVGLSDVEEEAKIKPSPEHKRKALLPTKRSWSLCEGPN